MDKDYYQILQVPYSASNDDIKRSFKKLAIKFHPDKTKDGSKHELFVKINEAYETLKYDDKKREYDLKNNINRTSTPLYSHTSTRSSGSTRNTNYASYTNQTSHSHTFFTRYYNPFYQQDDLLQKQKKAQLEKLRRDAEIQARRANQRAKERADEYLSQLKEEQERAEKIQREARQRRQNESEELYNQRKKQAYRTQWNQPLHSPEDEFLGTDFGRDNVSNVRNEPYDSGPKDTSEKETQENQRSVVEEELPEDSPQVTSNEKSKETPKETPQDAPQNVSQDSPQDSPQDTSGLKSDDPIIVDDAEDKGNTQNDPQVKTETNSTNNPESETNHEAEKEPELKANYDLLQNIFDEHMKMNPRKPPKKSFLFNDFKLNLRPDIGDVDFTEVLDSLPKFDKNTQQKESSPNKKAKTTPRYAEFSNGTSNADSIHIPVNRTFVLGHTAGNDNDSNKLTMFDFNASPNVRSIYVPRPPKISLSKDTTKASWLNYVTSIHEYQKDFLNYRKNIITYQMERASRDKELFDKINTCHTVFETYQKCLDQDLAVIQEYHERSREFNITMESYRQNCNWKQMAGLF